MVKIAIEEVGRWEDEQALDVRLQPRWLACRMRGLPEVVEGVEAMLTSSRPVTQKLAVAEVGPQFHLSFHKDPTVLYQY